MAHSYDRRFAAHWDASVLGITHADWAVMDAEEREEYIQDSLNRSADIAYATMQAFEADLSSGEQQAIHRAYKILVGLSRARFSRDYAKYKEESGHTKGRSIG